MLKGTHTTSEITVSAVAPPVPSADKLVPFVLCSAVSCKTHAPLQTGRWRASGQTSETVIKGPEGVRRGT